MNNSMFVGDYFKLRFQILQLIVDVLFLIWSKDGKNELQNLLNNSENIDQKECQIGGKKRNLAVSRVCSDVFSASLKTIEEK